MAIVSFSVVDVIRALVCADNVSEVTQQIKAERTVESAEAAAPFPRAAITNPVAEIVPNIQPNDDTNRVTPQGGPFDEAVGDGKGGRSPMPKSNTRKKKGPKRILALSDLEHAKTAVLNSLTSASGQRTYEHAIREFVTWYCSEPRLAFNRTVVLRYRIHLEQRGCAAATINLRLAAVRPSRTKRPTPAF